MNPTDIQKLSDGEVNRLFELILTERRNRNIIEKLKRNNRDDCGNKKLIGDNEYGIKKIPRWHATFITRISCLKSLIEDQNWKFLFDGQKLNDEKKYCVYAHVNPFKINEKLIRIINTWGTPFYIGKGTPERAHDLNRNQGHGIQIKKMLSVGHRKEDIVSIIKGNLTEIEALELEAKLICFFGTIYETSRKGILYNLDISKRPDFVSFRNKRTKIRSSQYSQEMAGR